LISTRQSICSDEKAYTRTRCIELVLVFWSSKEMIMHPGTYKNCATIRSVNASRYHQSPSTQPLLSNSLPIDEKDFHTTSTPDTGSYRKHSPHNSIQYKSLPLQNIGNSICHHPQLVIVLGFMLERFEREMSSPLGTMNGHCIRRRNSRGTRSSRRSSHQRRQGRR
jgi:hypothetical protein